jgi:hypothetical protein
MSLFLATFLTGILLVVSGALLLWKRNTTAAVAQAFPRSEPAAFLCMGLASGWFLLHVLQLSEADFGAYRHYLFIGFAAVAVLSFIHARDFLAVRGLAILILLTAHVLLEAAFMQEPASRLFLVSFVYLAIVVALYLGMSPFRLRDFLQWLFATRGRPRVLGGIFLGYGLILNLVAFTY